MSSGLVARVTRLDRRIGLAVVGLVLALLIGMPFYLMTGGGENGDGNGNAAGDASFVPVEGAPLVPGELPPLLSQEEMVALSVAATIEAIPTETPAPSPTPDVAATLQAQLAFNRELAPPVIALNPLASEEGRNPYLTSVELEFFRELGPRLWVYTQVWFHVRRVIAVEVSEWDSSVFGQDLEWAQMLLASAPDRAGYSGMSEVDSVVRSYADSIEAGMKGVSQAVIRLAEARSILEGEEVGPLERSKLIRLSREVEYLLDEFDGAMSAYGCSVCWELFRWAGRE
jgi:hypothetical protein